MVRILVATALLLSLTSGAWAVECLYTAFTMYIARQNQTHMTARSGQPCTMGNGVNASVRYGLHGTKITARPRNGSVVANGLIVTYRSRPGFKGQDFFKFSVIGSRHGQQKIMVEAPINVTVTVE
jgi:hypothetical protein